MNKGNHIPTDRDLYIGRGSKWGNPFKIGQDGTRQEVIEMYRHHLWSLMKSDQKIISDLMFLSENYDNLVCFCAPLACHGEIMIAAHNWLLHEAQAEFECEMCDDLESNH